MTRLRERRLVKAPLPSAHRLLDEVLTAHPAADGYAARFVLRSGQLEQPAIFSLQRAYLRGDMTPRYRLRWEAEGGGPFPRFNGELTIGANDDYDSFWLTIDGKYMPPHGIVGELFDRAVGHRIAEASTRGLLAQVQTEIEQRFRAEEGAKPPR